MAERNKFTTRSKTILAVIATILFLFAFVIDISFFGIYKIFSWRDVEVIRILAIVTIIIAVGILLAAIIFPNREYAEKLKLSIPLAIILFSFVSISTTAINYYEMKREYNYFSA